MYLELRKAIRSAMDAIETTPIPDEWALGLASKAAFKAGKFHAYSSMLCFIDKLEKELWEGYTPS